MKSMKELIETIGIDPEGWYSRSVAYSDSRTPLTNINKPVLAYGLGYNGFIAVFQDGHKKLKATAYGAKLQETKRPRAGFHDVNPEKALEQIQNNQLFAQTEIDTKKLEQAKKQDRPTLGKIKLKINPNKTHQRIEEYRIRKYKNGKIYAEKDSRWSNCNKTSIQNIIDLIDNKTPEYFSIDEVEVIENTVPKEIMKEMRQKILAKKL